MQTNWIDAQAAQVNYGCFSKYVPVTDRSEYCISVLESKCSARTGDFLLYIFKTSELAYLKLPLVLAEKLYGRGRINLKTKLALNLAFQEALINGLDHGNLELPSSWKEEMTADAIDRYAFVKKQRLLDKHYANRNVTVITACDDDRFLISIKDQGPGFKIRNDQAPAACRDLLACYGRGINIMSLCMDEVVYAEGGSKVVMAKQI